jgi:hypothetical protein
MDTVTGIDHRSYEVIEGSHVAPNLCLETQLAACAQNRNSVVSNGTGQDDPITRLRSVAANFDPRKDCAEAGGGDV